MTIQTISILVSSLLVIYILRRVLKRKLLETESIIWVTGSVIALILALFPRELRVISRWIGIKYPPATFFLIVIIFLSIITFRQFLMISTLTHRTTDLIQRLAILENELEQRQEHQASYISPQEKIR